MPSDEWDDYDDAPSDDPDAWRDMCDDPCREDFCS